MLAWRDRKAVAPPRLEPADDVAGAIEAELDEVTGGQNRRVAVVTDQDQMLVEASEVAVA
jgi:hypothetical protein